MLLCRRLATPRQAVHGDVPSFELAREAKAKRHVVDSRPATKITFGDYFAEWIETYAGRTRRGFSESTRIEYRRSIEVHVLSRWGTWKLTDIDRSAVSKLYKAVRKSSPSQVPKLRAALSALFATALEEEEVPVNPVAGIRVPAPVAGEPGDDRAKALTREELGLLLAAVPEDWRLFFEFLAVTGLRISEAVGLTWEHLDLGDGPRVLVREQLYEGKRKRLKSNAGRRDVPLSPAFAARLLSHRRDAYGGPSAPVFASTAGTPLRPSNVHRRVLAPGQGRRGAVLGHLPQSPPHLRVAAFRGRPQRQAGGRVAGSRGRRVHAADLRASVGRRSRRRARSTGSGQHRVNTTHGDSRKP